MSRRKKYIDGIYNWCDRWCERCAFTDRCRTFATQRQILKNLRQRHGSDSPSRAPSWESYDGLTESIGLWVAVERERDLAAWEAEHRRLAAEPLPRRAEAYADAVDEWFGRHPIDDAADPAIADAAQVIRWYQHFIHIKLLRASDTDESPDDEPDAQEVDLGVRDAAEQAERDDQNGTAKVVLIAVDRSAAAWAILERAGLPGSGPMVRQLDEIRRVTEQVFPHAREFVRPGLDWGE